MAQAGKGTGTCTRQASALYKHTHSMTAHTCSVAHRTLDTLGVHANETLHFCSKEGMIKFLEYVDQHGMDWRSALEITRQIQPRQSLASSTTSRLLGGGEAARCASPLGLGALGVGALGGAGATNTGLLYNAALPHRATLRAPSPLASGQSRPFSPQDPLARSASPLLGGGAMRVAPLAPQSALGHANATGMPTVVTPGWQALIHERDGSGSRSRSEESPMGAGIPDLGAGGFLHPDVYGQGGF